MPDGVLDGERLKAELFTTMLELTTGVCADVAEAVEELAALRVEARRRLHAHGLELAAAGTWPTAVLGEQPVTPLEPLRRFAEHAGPSALRQHCSGLHVHVGVASPEECMGRLEAVLAAAPGRARALGQLAVRGRGRDGPGLDPRRAAPAAAAGGRAAGLPRLRGVPGLRRAARRAGARRRPDAPLVGRAAPPAARNPGDPRAGPADAARRHRLAGRAVPRARGRRRSRARRPPTAASTPRTAGPPPASARKRP